MRYAISFQLYTARRFPPLREQLEELAAIGYDAVEPWPPAYDDPAEFRRMIDDAGLACPGFHLPLAGLVKDTQRYVDIAKTIGATLLIPPWLPPEEHDIKPDGWRRVGLALAEAAEKVRAYGLRVAWHNHDFEYFKLIDGSRPIDHILGAAGDGVGFEIDCGWVLRAGADPAAEMTRYAKRIWAIYARDPAPPGVLADNGWTAAGDGAIDWRALWPLMQRTPADHVVVIHDNPSDWQALARRSFDFLNRLNGEGS